MNIQFQICGLFILFLLLLFYKSNKTLQLYKEKIFYLVLCIIITSLTLDILSLVVIYYRQVLPISFVRFICKIYIISLLWGAWSAFIYVFTEMLSEKKHRKRTKRLAILTAVQSVIVLCLPIHIFAEQKIAYTYGPAVICIYLFVGIYIISTIAATTIFRKRLSPRKCFGILLWMAIWLISASLQFFNEGLLIVGFASSVGVLILFVLLENPEANLERSLGCFNSYALSEYSKHLLEWWKPMSILDITFENTDLFEEQGMDTFEVIQMLLKILKQYPDIYTFKNINLNLVVLSENFNSLKKACYEIQEHFSEYDAFQKEVSMVLAEHSRDFNNLEEFLDFKFYVRKKYRKDDSNLILIEQSMVEKYQEKYLVEQEIAQALEQDRVEVFLQPIFSAEEKSFTCAEALVRIRKSDGSLLPPGMFIPIAESDGQILELGERVFEKVCRLLKESDAVQRGVRYIEINLSVIQCEQKNLAERLIAIAKMYQVDPQYINLEITETASISAKNILLENMNQLIDYGFTFSLDDFGKGESNLMYVVDMPVSFVKLDYDLSKSYFISEKAKHVVRAVIEMAHGMNLKLVAEGIETSEENEAMLQEGIDYIQGFYHSRPITEHDFLEFLKARAIDK